MNRTQRITITTIIVMTVLGAAGYLKKRSLWHHAVARGQQELNQALEDLHESGQLRNNRHSDWGSRYIFTNLVTIGGTNYQCAAAYDDPYFYSAGFLAVTTNDVFIYFDKKHGSKLILTEKQ